MACCSFYVLFYDNKQLGVNFLKHLLPADCWCMRKQQILYAPLDYNMFETFFLNYNDTRNLNLQRAKLKKWAKIFAKFYLSHALSETWKCKTIHFTPVYCFSFRSWLKEIILEKLSCVQIDLILALV